VADPNLPECGGGVRGGLLVPQVPTLLLDVKSESSGFPAAPSHLFGVIWDSPSIATYSVKYSGFDYESKLEYQDQVESKFPDILQIGNYGVYHNIAYYRGNLIGDASVKFVDNGMGTYTVEQAVDLVLPLPIFPIDTGVFTSGSVFPKIQDLPAIQVGVTLHYGYFGSPNFETYKTSLAAAGFASSNGRSSDNVWVKEVVVGDEDDNYTLVYTFKHDKPLLDATIISDLTGAIVESSTVGAILGLLPDGKIKDAIVKLAVGTVNLSDKLGSFTNYYINNWTNIDKYASWTVNVKEE
ncbi:MAG: hypothetical protein LBH45_04680, partial [Campylobacteraceae bacterium]|nr:hypothetical protein [Campylobacteraceae bacterium]